MDFQWIILQWFVCRKVLDFSRQVFLTIENHVIAISTLKLPTMYSFVEVSHDFHPTVILLESILGFARVLPL